MPNIVSLFLNSVLAKKLTVFLFPRLPFHLQQEGFPEALPLHGLAPGNVLIPAMRIPGGCHILANS